jgi:hypothetical protein
MKIFYFFRKYMGKMAGAGAEIFDKLEPEPKFLTALGSSLSAVPALAPAPTGSPIYLRKNLGKFHA